MEINVLILRQKIVLLHEEAKFRRIYIEKCVRLWRYNCSDNIRRRKNDKIHIKRNLSYRKY